MQTMADGGMGGRAATLDAIVESIDLAPLEALLSRAEYRQVAFPTALEAQLFSLFDLPAPKGDWPTAAVTHAFDSGRRDAKWYLRADPVFVRATLNELILNDARALSLSLDEAHEFADLVNSHFLSESWCVEALHPERWYMCFEHAQRLTTTPLSMVRGSSIVDYMPAGVDAPRWHVLLNELQMLLHECEANRQRERRGLLPVNGLWLWGGGWLPSIKPPRWNQVFSDDVLAQSLASLSETRSADVPPSLQAWCEASDGPGRHLVIFEELYDSARLAQVERWYAGLRDLNTRWFEGIPDALKSGALDSVEFLVPLLGRYTSGRRGLARWWHRRRSFGTLMEARV